MRRPFLCFLAFICSVFLNVHGKSLVVNSQKEFDRLGKEVDSLANLLVEEVTVILKEGVYYYDDNHVLLRNKSLPGVKLIFSGEGATLIGRKDPFAIPGIENGYVDSTSLLTHNVMTSVRKGGFWPLPVMFRKGIYKLRAKEEPDVSENEAKGMKLVLSQWFVGAVYDVVKISGGYIYFKYVPYRTHLWSEFRYGRCKPRYFLFKPAETENLYPCGASNFLTVEASVLGEILLDGIRFLGNRDGERLLRFDSVQADSVVIRNCTFDGIRSRGILVSRTDNFRLRNSVFNDGFLNQVYIDKDSCNALIESNRFENNGLMMSNDPVVDCKGSGFRIRNNLFQNYSYSAIGLGQHFTDPTGPVTSGVVEANEIRMTESYRQKPMLSLIDGGAVYIWTQNQKVVIRNNYIHDISGPHGNRGIFGDDGVINLEICGNRVLRVDGGYAIDVRRAAWVKNRRGSVVKRTNIGIRIHDNDYTGRVRIFVRKDDPDSYSSDNHRLD